MELWDRVCITDPAITKGAKIGAMNITAISPQHQRKKATEIFGSYGIGWGINVNSESFTFNTFGGVTLVSYSSVMFYEYNGKRGEIPINAVVKVAYITQGKDGYLKVDDEYTKKVQTNALTKGLSTLGFNSDVFEGKFDDCKYVSKIKAEFAVVNKAKTEYEEKEAFKTAKISADSRTKLFALTKSLSFAPEVITEYLNKVHNTKSSADITNDLLVKIKKDINEGTVEIKIQEYDNANQ